MIWFIYLAREKFVSLVLSSQRCDSPWTKHWPVISQLSVQHSNFDNWDPCCPSDNLEAIEGIKLCGNDHLPVMQGQGEWAYKHVRTEQYQSLSLHTAARAAGATPLSCAVAWGTCWVGGMWWGSRNTVAVSCMRSQVMFDKCWHSLRSEDTLFVLCQTKFVSWEIIGFFMAFVDFS